MLITFHSPDCSETHVHKTLTSFMAMSFRRVLITAFPIRPKTTIHTGRNSISHGFPDLDMVATDKTAYFESESGDDFSQTVSGAFHLHRIRFCRYLFEKNLAAYQMKTTKIYIWLGNGCGRLCLASCPSQFHI